MSNSMLGRTMLERKTIEALLDGKTEEIRSILQEKGPELLSQRDGEGQTPLMLATENGDAEMARFLLKQGAPPNDLNNFEQSSVHYACFEGQPEILQLLLDNGGDVNIQDDIGQSPLHDAAESEHHYMQLYKILLHHGARVNVKNDDGDTPLHVASSYGRLEATQLLLDEGADLLARNKQGQTPLDVAQDIPTQTALRMHRSLQATRDRLELLVWRSIVGGSGTTVSSNNNHINMPAAAAAGNCSNGESNNNPLYCSSTLAATTTTAVTTTTSNGVDKDELMEQLEMIIDHQKDDFEDVQLQFSTLFQQNRAQKAETVALRKLVEKQHEQHKLGLAQLSKETNEKLDLFLVQLRQEQQQQQQQQLQANTDTNNVDSLTMSCSSTGGSPQLQQKNLNIDLVGLTNRMDVMTTHFMVTQVMLVVMALVYFWNTKRFAFRVSSSTTSSSSTPSFSKKTNVAKPTLLDHNKSPSRSKNGNSKSNTATTTTTTTSTVSSPTSVAEPALLVAELQEQIIQYQAEVEEYKRKIAQLVLVQKKLMKGF